MAKKKRKARRSAHYEEIDVHVDLNWEEAPQYLACKDEKDAEDGEAGEANAQAESEPSESVPVKAIQIDRNVEFTSPGEGKLRAEAGEYIIRSADGDISVCDPVTFGYLYEKAGSENPEAEGELADPRETPEMIARAKRDVDALFDGDEGGEFDAAGIEDELRKLDELLGPDADDEFDSPAP